MMDILNLIANVHATRQLETLRQGAEMLRQQLQMLERLDRG